MSEPVQNLSVEDLPPVKFTADGETEEIREAILEAILPSRGYPTAVLLMAVPSLAEYMHMGDMTTRFMTVMPRSVNGVNMGAMELSDTWNPLWVRAVTRQCKGIGGQSSTLAAVVRVLSWTDLRSGFGSAGRADAA